MPRWIPAPSRSFWLSLAVGVVVALVALPSFTDTLLRNLGGFIFTVVVVAAIVRKAIASGQAFMEGWREPKRPASR